METLIRLQEDIFDAVYTAERDIANVANKDELEKILVKLRGIAAELDKMEALED